VRRGGGGRGLARALLMASCRWEILCKLKIFREPEGRKEFMLDIIDLFLLFFLMYGLVMSIF
jgi:hypothetical protein